MPVSAMGSPVELFGDIVAQGELVVGSGTVRLVAATTACKRVWIGAPTANHTVGAANDGNILIGGNASSNASGGIPLAPTDTAGVWIWVPDAGDIYLTGFNAGDVVEYMIVR